MSLPLRFYREIEITAVTILKSDHENWMFKFLNLCYFKRITNMLFQKLSTMEKDFFFEIAKTPWSGDTKNSQNSQIRIQLKLCIILIIYSNNKKLIWWCVKFKNCIIEISKLSRAYGNTDICRCLLARDIVSWRFFNTYLHWLSTG